MCESPIGLERHKSQSRTDADRDVCTNPSTLSLRTMLPRAHTIETIILKRITFAIAIDVHTAFLHIDIDQDLYAEPLEESELNEDEVWKLHKALYEYRKAPKLWHQHVVTIRESLNFH